MIPVVRIGDQLTCPVCGADFKATADTKYIAKGGYTCSWKCFLIRDKEVREAKKKE